MQSFDEVHAELSELDLQKSQQEHEQEYQFMEMKLEHYQGHLKKLEE